MLQFTYHTDPGHGWVEVSKKFAKELGIEDKISSYSYKNAYYYFLEEDCDAGLLIKALKESGTDYQLDEKHVYNDHWIRNLNRAS